MEHRSIWSSLRLPALLLCFYFVGYFVLWVVLWVWANLAPGRLWS